MEKKLYLGMALLAVTTMSFLSPVESLLPYARPSSIWDVMFPTEDPFRILEHSPLASISRPSGQDDGSALALARADWRETPAAHEISLDVPGMRREDIKIEVEDNRVLRVSGERKAEEEVKDERWHRVERSVGVFWRQFRLPANADVEKVSARLEEGVLRINVPKLGEQDRKKEPKVISIVAADDQKGTGDDVAKPSKQEL